MKRIVVLISGNGSNLQAVLDAIQSGNLVDVSVVAVISDRKHAYGLQRAKENNIPAIYFPFRKNIEDRNSYDERLATEIEKYCPHFIFCLGFLHVFSQFFVIRFNRKLINLHPALPNTFTGLNCIEKQYEAMVNEEITEAGVMCHYVDSGVDTGEVIATKKISVYKNISLKDFEEAIHEAEHHLVVEVIKTIF